MHILKLQYIIGHNCLQFLYEQSPRPVFFSFLVLSVEFQSIEYNVDERNGTLEIVLIANTTSEFDYTVALIARDITTGM